MWKTRKKRRVGRIMNGISRIVTDWYAGKITTQKALMDLDDLRKEVADFGMLYGDDFENISKKVDEAKSKIK
jgi:septation ring formation regulator EzrA